MNNTKKVHVVFKTHLDIGFTNLAAHVLRQYMEEYIPKAIALADTLEAEGGRAQFVWTTGSWLIRYYLIAHLLRKEKRWRRQFVKDI